MNTKLLLVLVAVVGAIYWFTTRTAVPKTLSFNNIEFKQYKVSAHPTDLLETFYYRGSDGSEFQIKFPHKKSFHNAQLVYDSSVYFVKASNYQVDSDGSKFFVATKPAHIMYGAINRQNSKECLMIRVIENSTKTKNNFISTYNTNLVEMENLVIF